MPSVRINPVGMTSTTEGYCSSVTVYTNGSPTVLTPDANGVIVVSATAATNLCQPDFGADRYVSG